MPHPVTKARDLLTDADFDGLVSALTDFWLAGLEDAYDLAGQAVGERIRMKRNSPAMRRIIREIGERITAIENTTRQRVGAYVTSATESGLSPDALADMIEGDASGAFNAVRAMTISRTEAALVYSRGSTAAYRDSGRVEKVIVFDGDGCGWTGHDDPDLADGSVRTLDEAEEWPLAHPNCFSGDTMVIAPNVRAAFARWFQGEVVILRTAADDLLTCTPNHPILTHRGWVSAGLIQQGDHVIRCTDAQGVAALVDPDNDHLPARIEEVARTVLEACGGVPTAVPSASVAVHGDGAGSDVYVVGSDCLREHGRDSSALKHARQVTLALTDVGLSSLFADGAPGEVLGGSSHAANGIMRGGDSGQPVVGAQAGHFQGASRGQGSERIPSAAERGPQHTAVDAYAGGNGVRSLAGEVAAVERLEVEGQALPTGHAQGEPRALEVSGERGSPNAVALGDDFDRLARLVETVEVVHVERRQFTGHVYNLETVQGWYVADSIIAHNCVRAFAPYVESASDASGDAED